MRSAYLSIILSGTVGTLTPTLVVSAQASDLTYRDVPRISALDPVAFARMLSASSDRVVRIAMFGDSQETSPWGWGRVYVPSLNARLARVFGPCSETMLLSCIDMVERSQWLATVSRAVPASDPVASTSQLLPCVGAQHLDASSGTLRAVLLHDASRTEVPSLNDGAWLVPGPYYADILAFQASEASDVSWSNQPILGSDPEPAPSVQQGSVSFAARTDITSPVWKTVGPFNFSGKRHIQLSLGASEGGKGVDLVGLRFHAAGPGRGVVLQSFARGGMRLPQLIEDYPDSAPLLRALAPDCVALHYGANDAMQMTDIEAWRHQLLQAIQWARTLTGNPVLPIVIINDMRGGTGGLPFDMIDRMPVIAHQVAMQDPRVLSINLRRVTEEEYLWGTTTFYLADMAHFHPYAQRLEAEAVVGELCRYLGIYDPTCSAVKWSDCVRALGATCQLGGCNMIMDVEVVEFGIRWHGVDSSCADQDRDGYPDLCPPGGPADINRDGLVNGGDLGLLLGAWSTPSATADINGDGNVDGIDLGILLASWGT